MDDLPKELRRIADIELVGYSEEMMRKAADEIERLRESVRSWGEIADGCTFDDLGKICDYCRCGRENAAPLHSP